MVVTIVEVSVNIDHIDDFIIASAKNHQASIQEPGNRRFDILQSPEDNSKFILYEAYATSDDAAAHKQTPHYREWRDRVAPWMEQPRNGIPYHALYPKF